MSVSRSLSVRFLTGTIQWALWNWPQPISAQIHWVFFLSWPAEWSLRIRSHSQIVTILNIKIAFCKISPILIRSHNEACQEMHSVKSFKSQNGYEDTKVSVILCSTEFSQQLNYLFSSNTEIFLFMNKLRAAGAHHLQQGPQAAHKN